MARRAEGRSPVFQTRLWGAGSANFAPFATSPADPESAPDVVIIPGQGFTKVDDIPTDLKSLTSPPRLPICGRQARRVRASPAVAPERFYWRNRDFSDSRKATTSWWLAPVFSNLFPEVDLDTRVLVCTDGTFTTAGAAMAQMDLMVGLVARHAGARIATWCIRTMLLDERRSQTPYMGVSMLAARDDRMADVAAWARDRLEEGLSVAELADRAVMSTRTFARRVQRATGMSPIAFLQRIRVERAVECETTRLPFEVIAAMVGYAEPSTLRAVIRRELGIRPSEVRARAAPLAA